MADRLVAGRFELLDVVGSGAFGVVWRAYDWKHRKLVAVKIFSSHASEPELIHRFVQEQGLRLSHPNVLAPLDFFSDSEQAALVMDLAEGGSLEQLAAGGRPTLSTAIAVLEQLLEGVAYVCE
jgi:eukaryotic-like serine/threonine-protein kinase